LDYTAPKRRAFIHSRCYLGSIVRGLAKVKGRIPPARDQRQQHRVVRLVNPVRDGDRAARQGFADGQHSHAQQPVDRYFFNTKRYQ